MTAHVHPLTGKLAERERRIPEPRFDDAVLLAPLSPNRRRANLSYDSARSGTDLDAHWAFADSLDPDCSNNIAVRHTLMKRSRYEQGSSGYYDGSLTTYCNMLVGDTGPQLRMLTKSRAFNQLVEREFYAWATKIQLRRKLWAMAHARIGDGETFAVIQNNPSLPNDAVQLDFMPIEAEQCQTPFVPLTEKGYIDGIRFDEYGNILWYDILPEHPGSNSYFGVSNPVPVPASSVVHWFKLKRPGGHRGVPDCTSTLNVGASSRRFREATVAAAETAADLAAISTTQAGAAGDDEAQPVAPFTGVPLPKRTWAFNPRGWDIHQMKAEHPNAQYSEFNRQQISEQVRPLSMPYNAAACDSSTYSFASGKLDTICFRTELNVQRADCNDLVLDVLFAQWFREWTLLRRGEGAADEAFTPDHQWDWPLHPVIDAVAEANATDTKLKNGTATLRQVFSDQGQDFEDQLNVMAEDWFGEASDENVTKARQICLLRTTPQHAIQYVAQAIGLQVAQPPVGQPTVSAHEVHEMKNRIAHLEAIQQ